MTEVPDGPMGEWYFTECEVCGSGLGWEWLVTTEVENLAERVPEQSHFHLCKDCRKEWSS